MKMKKIFFVYIFLFSYTLYAKPDFLEKHFMHTDEYSVVCISENKINIDNVIENGKLIHYYGIDSFKGTENNYVILHGIVSDIEFLYLIKNVRDAKYAFESWEMTYINHTKESKYISAKLVPFKVENVSSFVVEKDKEGNDIRFIPENSNLFFMESNPWAVSKEGNAIIELSTERWRNNNIHYSSICDIIIVNGFVFPGKEYLYEQNSRAKKIQILYNNICFEAELQDVGNFQIIHLPISINPMNKNKLKIKILDCYEGTKYSDIVISAIYYMEALTKN